MSTRGLKSCTFWRAIWARRTRRMSSSLLPLNMLPVMASIQPAPAPGRGFTGWTPGGLLGPLDVGAAGGVDADHVALGDEGRHVDHEPGLHLRRLVLVGDGGPLDGGLGLEHRHLHREGE